PTELHYLVQCVVFVSSVTQTSAIYTLSLHDALPIWSAGSPPPPGPSRRPGPDRSPTTGRRALRVRAPRSVPADRSSPATVRRRRSEEHTSELQSRFDLVCRLLLEKKKSKKYNMITYH